MSEIINFFKGIRYFFSSFGLIFEKGLWHFLLYPVIIRILFFLLISIGLFSLQETIENSIKDLLSMKNIPLEGHHLSWLKNIITPSPSWISGLLASIFSIIVLWTLSIMNKYVVLIIISPVLAILSERTEEKLTGKKFTFDFLQFIKDILRAILIAIRNMSLEYLLFFGGFFLLIIPVFGAILFGAYQLFLLLMSWYFFGFSMIDYSSERHRFSTRKSIALGRKNKGVLTGIGFCYWSFITIPIFGSWIGFTFAPILGAVGATAAFIDINKNN
jgi:CysZ protein